MREFLKKIKNLGLVLAVSLAFLGYNNINSSSSNNVIVENQEETSNNSYRAFDIEINPANTHFHTNISGDDFHTTILATYPQSSNYFTKITAPSGYRKPLNISAKWNDNLVTNIYTISELDHLDSSIRGIYYDYVSGEIRLSYGLITNLVNEHDSKFDIYLYFSNASNDYWIDEIPTNHSLSLENSSSSNSETNPFLITSAIDLAYVSLQYDIGKMENKKNAFYKITNDIDLDGRYFLPIGTKQCNFTGSIDGNNKIISNLKILVDENINNDNACFGLIGYAKSTDARSISDMIIKNVYFSYDDANNSNYDEAEFGALAGYIYNYSVSNIIIENINFIRSNTSNTMRIVTFVFGGLLGGSEKTDISDSLIYMGEVYMNIESSMYYFGGLIGHYQSGNIDGAYVFYDKTITINDSYSDSYSFVYIGGFIGKIDMDGSNVVFSNIYITTDDDFSYQNVFIYHYSHISGNLANRTYISSFIGYVLFRDVESVYFYNCETCFYSTNANAISFYMTDDNTDSNHITSSIYYGNIYGLFYLITSLKGSLTTDYKLFNCSFYTQSVSVVSDYSLAENKTCLLYGELYIRYTDDINLMNYNFYTQIGNKNGGDDSTLFSVQDGLDMNNSNLLGTYISNHFQSLYYFDTITFKTSGKGTYTLSNSSQPVEEILNGYKTTLNGNIETADYDNVYKNITKEDMLAWRIDTHDYLRLTNKVIIVKNYINGIDPDIEEATFNATKTLADSAHVIANKLFAGWYYDENYETPLTNLNTTYILAFRIINVYAKYVDSITIAFDTNGGSAKDSITGVIGSALNLGSNPTREGYTFAGWYCDAALTEEFTYSVFMNDYPILYAKWTQNETIPEIPVIVFPHPTFNITYVTNGGVINDTSYPTSYKTGDTVVLPSDVTKASATFLGWYEHDNFSGSAVTNLSQFAMGDFTFYAKWNVSETPSIEHKITYILNNGTILDSTYATSFIEGIGTTNIPTNVILDGFTFDGWYDNKDFTGSSIKEIGSDVKSDVTLYAKFTKNEEKKDNNNNNNLWWLLLLLLIPIIGLIIWLILRNKKKKEEVK